MHLRVESSSLENGKYTGIRKTDGEFSPKNVLSVNINGHIVADRNGIVQGPYTHEEWLGYSHDLWLKFNQHLFPEKFATTLDGSCKKPDWRDVYFRSNDHYYAGSFNHFSDQWLVTINSLPDDDDLKHKIYKDVHSGVDIFHGILPIPREKAREHRDGNKYYTVEIPHKYNCWVHSKLGKLTEVEKIKFNRWYPKVKSIFRLKDPKTGMLDTNAHIPTPPAVLTKYEQFIKTQLGKWMDRGSIIEVNSERLATTNPLVVADEEGKKLRPCFDGSLLSLMETRKSPCVLDTIPSTFPLISRGTILTKMDDQSGFHQFLMNVDSIEQSGHKFWGKGFTYIACPFGIPIIPAVFQRGNNCAVNYLRSQGVPVSLYLDDRMMYDDPIENTPRGHTIKRKIGEYKTPQWRKLDEQFLAPLNAYLTILICLAVGGFVHLGKSELWGTTEIEFLGMALNTKTQTILVPQRKWDKLMSKMEWFIDKLGQWVFAKDLEKLRGLAISFVHAVPNARMYIRRMTEILTNTLGKGHKKFKVPIRLLEEFNWWRGTKYIAKECSWLPKEICHLEVKNLFTDASLYAGGILILKTETEVTHATTLYWDIDESNWPIHLKEAIIILKALELNKTLLGNKLIHNFTDNSAVYHASKFGCSNPILNDIIVRIHQLTADIGSEIRFTLIRTHLQLADGPSRPQTDYNEEIIHPMWVTSFEFIIKAEFELDGFAASWNHIKSDIRWVSKTFEDSGWSTNFFTITRLGNLNNFWFFPPKCISNAALTHIWTYFQHKTWVFVFHRFLEWPQILPLMVKDPSTTLFRIGNKARPACLVPSKKKCSDLVTHPFYRFNSGPTETWAIVHTPGGRPVESDFTDLIQYL